MDRPHTKHAETQSKHSKNVAIQTRTAGLPFWMNAPAGWQGRGRGRGWWRRRDQDEKGKSNRWHMEHPEQGCAKKAQRDDDEDDYDDDNDDNDDKHADQYKFAA